MAPLHLLIIMFSSFYPVLGIMSDGTTWQILLKKKQEIRLMTLHFLKTNPKRYYLQHPVQEGMKLGEQRRTRDLLDGDM